MKRRSKTDWEALIAEYEKSGQPQAEWCRTKNINLYTFRDRKSQLHQNSKTTQSEKQEKKSVPELEWLPITPKAPPLLEKADIQVKIGEFTIIAVPDFNEETFSRVCKVLVEL